MPIRNKYIYRSRISEAKFRQILRLFCLDLTAVQTAELSGISRNSVNTYLTAIRRRIAEFCESESPFSGQVEVDESLFGARRVKGKRGRGAYGKVWVFGLYKRNGKVYTEVVPNASKKTLQGIIRGKVALESVIHSDGWRGYNGLVDVGYDKHYRVHHGNDEFARGSTHINGIESFWSYAKRRLARFNGIRHTHFILHLKETEFRFNYRNNDLYSVMLEHLRADPL